MSPVSTHGRYEPGDSFLPEARRLVQDHAGDLVELVVADLSRFEWTGEPIKLLLVDAMKDAALVSQIARSFYPALIPSTTLIHQDFKHFYTSWIHVLHYRLRDYFRLTHSVADSGTVAFELCRPLSADTVAAVADIEHVTDDEADASFDYSFSLLDVSERVNVAAAHVAHYCHHVNATKARELFEKYQRLGWTERGEFPKVIQLLDHASV